LLQDGGSLDLILKKSGRIPEPILGRISGAVSVRRKCSVFFSGYHHHHQNLLWRCSASAQ